MDQLASNPHFPLTNAWTGREVGRWGFLSNELVSGPPSSLFFFKVVGVSIFSSTETQPISSFLRSFDLFYSAIFFHFVLFFLPEQTGKLDSVFKKRLYRCRYKNYK